MVDTIILKFDGQNFTSNNQTNNYGIVGTNMTINWGDGEEETLTSATKFNHNYSTDEIHTIIINGDTITGIDANCFKNCVGLISVELPSTITSIGNDSFKGCTDLNILILNWETSASIISFNSNWVDNNSLVRYIIPNGTLSYYLAKDYPNASEYCKQNVPLPEKGKSNAYSTKLSGYFYNKLDSITNTEFTSSQITEYGISLDENNKIDISTTSKLVKYLKSLFTSQVTSLRNLVDANRSDYDTYIASLETRLNRIEGNVTDYWKTVYPIGSIYITLSSEDPSITFGGGSWEKIEGKFLLSAGTVRQEFEFDNTTQVIDYIFNLNDSGGEVEHRLVERELAKHWHDLHNHYHATGTSLDYFITAVNADRTKPDFGTTSYRRNLTSLPTTGDTAKFINVSTYKANVNEQPYTSNGIYTGGGFHPIEEAGENVAHNNMPPYLVVNMWRRTA